MLYPEFYAPFESLFDPWFADSPERMPRPAGGPMMKTDIKETEDAYELLMELPGIKKENLKAELHKGYLTVSAVTEQEEDANYLRKERFIGTYSRSFYVGENLREADIKAKYTDGILQLTIPKITPTEPEKKCIAIEG